LIDLFNWAQLNMSSMRKVIWQIKCW